MVSMSDAKAVPSRNENILVYPISVCTVRQRTRGTRAPSGTQTTDGNYDNFLEEFIKLTPTMEL